jgi:hypothetical protein
MLLSVAGERTLGAVWSNTEETDRCGFKLRSNAESDPHKEEF